MAEAGKSENVAEAGKSSEIINAESNLRVVRLIERGKEVKRIIRVEEDADVVAFTGPTKGGKSTAICFLSDTELICTRDSNNDVIVVKASNDDGPAIGVGGESETEKPEFYQNVPGTNYSMLDLPGQEDTAGPEQEIINAFAFEYVLRPLNSVRFVLVCPFDLIKSQNSLPFYRYLYSLSKICPEISESLCIASTKDTQERVEVLLNTAKSHVFTKAEKENIDIINVAKPIIEKVLANKTCIDLLAPVLEKGLVERPFTLPNKQAFIECIKKLKGTKVTGGPLVISSTAVCYISEIYTVCQEDIKREVASMIALIELYVQKKIDEILEAKVEDGKPTSAESRLAHFKMGKRTIEGIIEKSSNFKEFSIELKKVGVGINERFLEKIEKFNYAEKLKNMYKMSEVEASAEGESDFFKNIRLALNRAAQKYSSLIETSGLALEEEKRVETEFQARKMDEMNALNKQIAPQESKRSREIDDLMKKIDNLEHDKLQKNQMNVVMDALLKLEQQRLNRESQKELNDLQHQVQHLKSELKTKSSDPCIIL